MFACGGRESPSKSRQYGSSVEEQDSGGGRPVLGRASTSPGRFSEGPNRKGRSAASCPSVIGQSCGLGQSVLIPEITSTETLSRATSLLLLDEAQQVYAQLIAGVAEGTRTAQKVFVGPLQLHAKRNDIILGAFADGPFKPQCDHLCLPFLFSLFCR